MSTRVLTAHIPEELAEKVDRYAVSMERSRAWIVKQALSNWVDWEEEKLRRTLEGLADVDAGRLIDHEDMVAWANSLGTDKPLALPVRAKDEDTLDRERSARACQARIVSQPVNELAAARAVQMLVSAPDKLHGMPRMGERVEEIPDREVRRMLAAPYELLYEILPDEIAILRVFHTREDR